MAGREKSSGSDQTLGVVWGSVAKRLWLKASAQEDVATLRVLYPLFSSPACALAQVRAESEVLRSMLTTLPPELLLGNPHDHLLGIWVASF